VALVKAKLDVPESLSRSLTASNGGAQRLNGSLALPHHGDLLGRHAVAGTPVVWGAEEDQVYWPFPFRGADIHGGFREIQKGGVTLGVSRTKVGGLRVHVEGCDYDGLARVDEDHHPVADDHGFAAIALSRNKNQNGLVGWDRLVGGVRLSHFVHHHASGAVYGTLKETEVLEEQSVLEPIHLHGPKSLVVHVVDRRLERGELLPKQRDRAFGDDVHLTPSSVPAKEQGAQLLQHYG
jgi:hypothetical protein